MNIFLINFILMLFEALFLLYRPRKDPNISKEQLQTYKKWFVVLQCFQWILISTLRDNSVGSDTSNYIRIFEMDAELSWRECFEYFKNYYFREHTAMDMEPGYILFEKLIASIWYHEGFYKFAIAAIFMPSMGYFIYKYSDDPCLAFMLYFGLFYNMFSLTGYRQVLSVSIGIFWSYKYVKQRKFWKFLLLVLVAATIHKSTLVFIAFYFLSQKKITSLYMTTAIIAIAGMIVFREQIFEYVKIIVGYEEFGVESGFTQRNFLLLFSVLTILALWRYPYVARRYPDAGIYYNALVLSWAMVPFAMVSPTSMRLVYDFGFMLMILVPKIYRSFRNKKDTVLAYTISILVFGFFIAVKAIPYKFFWQ